jgi:ABC-type multidrug transport system ATPase subunit
MGIRRGGRWLLRPASFAIAAGVVGVAGAPGVGKSTLLATFGTLRRPSSGALEVLGNDISGQTGRRIARAGLGYLPGHRQDPDMTAGDLIAYAGYFKRVPPGAVQAAMRRFGLTDVAGLTLTRLPDDVRLRAGIAAACVGAPRLVLLDAPMAGFDARSWTELVPLLRDAAPAVIVTARDTEDLTGWCDQVFVMARGRLNRLLPPHRPVPRPRDSWQGARQPPPRPSGVIPAGSGVRD